MKPKIEQHEDVMYVVLAGHSIPAETLVKITECLARYNKENGIRERWMLQQPGGGEIRFTLKTTRETTARMTDLAEALRAHEAKENRHGPQDQ